MYPNKQKMIKFNSNHHYRKNFLLIFLLITLLSVTSSSSSSSFSSSSSVINDRQQQQQHHDGMIINGDVVIPPNDDVTHQVAILRQNIFICSGVLIRSRTVLSAAHCFVEFESKPEIFSVRYSTLNYTTGPIVPIQRIILHPSFTSKTFYNDLALLTLKHRLKQNDLVSVISIASATPTDGTPLRITGWGRYYQYDDQPSTPATSEIMLKATLQCINVEGCAKIWADDSRISPPVLDGVNLCAKSYPAQQQPEQQQSACKGDSGGPVVVMVKQKKRRRMKFDDIATVANSGNDGGDDDGDYYEPQLVGIVSWGSATCLHSLPNVFATVTQVNIREWIELNWD